MKFHKIKQVGDLIGFASFKYNGIGFSEIGVHRLLEPKGNVKVRLLFPEKVKPFRDMQVAIDEEISAYISANYKECLNGQASAKI